MSQASSTAPQSGTQPPAGAPPIDLSTLSLANLDRNQIMALLSQIPGVFKQGSGDSKEDAAQALSHLAAQNPSFLNNPALAIPPPPAGGFPGVNDPGPSSHPRGPPNLGELSAVAMQAAPQPAQRPEGEEGEAEAQVKKSSTTAATTTGGRRSRGGAAMGSEEWTRQRKDNHKEVERRRRGNINEGINELGRIVPSGSGEKAKGAILSRAVQYIHHLKENEARNIEKWTLEKLLMDQAMGDLQAQLEEVRRLWEEERSARQRLEAELEALKGGSGGSTAGQKRSSPDGEARDDDSKRQRTE